MSVYGPARKQIIAGNRSPEAAVLTLTCDVSAPRAGVLSARPAPGEADGAGRICASCRPAPARSPAIATFICISWKGLARQIIPQKATHS